jgi:hypothetical protein
MSLFSPSLKQCLLPENISVLTITEAISLIVLYHCSHHPWNSFSYLKISLLSPSLKQFLPPENIPVLTITEAISPTWKYPFSHLPETVSLAWQYPCHTIPDQYLLPDDIPDQYLLPDDIPGISVNRSGGDDSNHGCKKATLTII